MKNIDLFNISLKNSEPYIDDYYAKNSEPIITNASKKNNELMRANTEIISIINDYKKNLTSKNIQKQQDLILEMIELLKVDGMNFSEFANYWATKDVSFSIYDSTLKSLKLKIEFLKNILPEYIKDRNDLYLSRGYSFSTLQAVMDSKAHKSNGNAGNIKMMDILVSSGFSELITDDINIFKNSNKVFIFPDKKSKKIFKKILQEYDIKFEWSLRHENKQTDCLIKNNDNIYIVEHKHMKESGGGQDKQMTEIIDFISYKDKKVHYVSFLDGIYFNLLADPDIVSGKTFTQRITIQNNLKNNPQNFFVNTFGFKKLIKEII